MSFKAGIHESADGPASTNNCAFATEDEAKRAGTELLRRWMAPHHASVVESAESVNYEFPIEIDSPRKIKQPFDANSHRSVVAAGITPQPAKYCPECRTPWGYQRDGRVICTHKQGGK